MNQDEHYWLTVYAVASANRAPANPWHSQREQALPGPTRLTWRNKRFEPEAGLSVLLGD